jgi:hypothetical protein
MLLLAIVLSSCGGNSQHMPDSQESGTVSGSELLSQLDSMDAPADLKSALKQALDIAPDSRFLVHPPQGPRSQVTDLTLAILPDGSSGIQWTYVNPGDYNYDGQVNLHDLANLGAWLGVDSTNEAWERAKYVDGDGNGAITLADITPLAANFLGTVVAYQVEGATLASSFQQLSQVPYSEGERLAELTPPHFTATTQQFDEFRITALDSLAQPAAETSPSHQLMFRPGLVLCDGAGQPTIDSYSNGVAVVSSSEGPLSLSAGQYLLGEKYLLKIEELVADDNQSQVVASPASLGEIIASGVLNIDLAGADGLGNDFGISGSWFTDKGLKVTAVDGHYKCDASDAVQASYDPRYGLTFVKVSMGGDVDFTLDLQLDATGPTEVGRSSGSVGMSTFPATVAIPGTSLSTTLWVEKGASLVVEGNGKFDGTSRLHFNGHFSGLKRSSVYNAQSKEWTEETSFALTSDPHLEPELNVADAETSVKVELVLTTRIYLFGTSLSGASPLIDNRLGTSFLHEGTHAASQSKYIESGSAGERLAINLEALGVPLLTYVADGDLGSDVIRTGTITDPAPPTTRTISGHVFDGSSPHSDVTITVRDSGTSAVLGTDVTDDQGAYEVAELPDGAGVIVTAALEGYSFQPPAYGLVLDSDKTADFAGVPVSAQTYGVSGYLREFDSALPIVGAQVYLYGAGGIELLAQTETNGEGHYSFGSLSPFSTVRVVTAMSGYGFVPDYAEFTVTGEMGQDFTGYLGESL